MTQAIRGIGVDVGGTSIKFSVVSPEGEILHRSSVPTGADDGPDAVLTRIAGGIEQMLSGHRPGIVGIGVGVPGVTNERGEVAYPPNFPGWEIVPVAERLRDMVGTWLPIAVENDANIAAFAEARIGQGHGIRDFLYVTLGTGVGGCIISEGKIWRSKGEFGHITVDAHGPPCNCGSRGCIEAFIGQRYMSAIAVKQLAAHPDSALHPLISGGRELDPQLLDEAACAGDQFATEFMEEMGELLGAALASALNLCDLHTVVVGGGMSRAESTLIEPARRSLRSRVLKSIAGDVELRVARFSGDAGIVGAALYGIDRAGL